jgi:hypothetical protein
VAIGRSSIAGGLNSVAVGDSAQTNADHSIAIGFSSYAYAVNAISIGANAQNITTNTIQLGDSTITAVSSAGTFTTTSDARTKTNITENIPGLAFITQLRPVTYNNDPDGIAKLMKIPEERRSAALEAEQAKVIKSGFIAQEVEKAAQSIGYSFNGICAPATEGGHYSLAYSQFVVPLVQACKEQQAMILALQARLDVLEARP